MNIRLIDHPDSVVRISLTMYALECNSYGNSFHGYEMKGSTIGYN